MKTFAVTQNGKDAGTVTAYTYTEAVRKAALKLNNGEWVGIGVKHLPKKQPWSDPKTRRQVR